MPLTKTTLAQALSLRTLHPVVLDLVLLEVFGPEWISWDPDSTEIALNRLIAPRRVSRSSREKIRGLGVVHSNYLYWEDWRTFETVSWALNGHSVDLRIMNPLKTIPMCYAYRAVTYVSPKHEFDDEVKAYILTVLHDEQFSVLPEDFSWLQKDYEERFPEVLDRREEVAEALKRPVPDSVYSEEQEDPVLVEVARHRIIKTTLNILSSKKVLKSQAKMVGVQSKLEALLRGR